MQLLFMAQIEEHLVLGLVEDRDGFKILSSVEASMPEVESSPIPGFSVEPLCMKVWREDL